MRRRLRAATNEVHERLHGHDGFAAAASGTISTEDYRDLLARLYGFHAAFDDAMERAPSDLARDIELPARARDVLLALDLLGLGVEAEMLSRLPRPTLAPLSGEGEHLGALYVVEGSTMGGVIIARALGGFGENRRFYLGHGADHGRLWRVFLARLDTLEGEAADAAERAAAQVFSAFDTWMANWRGGLARVREETA
jgi:heme oxygenase